MIKSYLKTAWRNLSRNKSFSTINILGLSLGMACTLLILLWVADEKSVDGFHAKGKQLFQVYERNYYDGKVSADYPTQGLLAPELKKNVPEIEMASGFERASAPGTKSTFEFENKVNKMEGYFVGVDFLQMFSYKLLSGNPATCLIAPEDVAISRQMAEMFYGSPNNAMGKTIRYENREDLKITAVFENIPSNSSQQFDYLRTWTAFERDNDWMHHWGNTDPATYVLLRNDADPAKVEAKIKDFIYRYIKPNEGAKTELALQSYPQKYLHSNFEDGKISGGRIEYVNLFTLIAVFIILIACINYMNLATAQSARRAKEVGLRKVVGAARTSLISQFFGEAMMLTVFSIIIAILMASIALPAFNNLTGKQLSLPFDSFAFWGSLLALVATVGLLAGSYPAIYLSALKPALVLKGSLKFNWKSTVLRQGLVVFQFALSVILIVGMIVIYKQLNFIQSKNLGYDRENLVYVPLEGDLANKYVLFKEEALKIPGISNISKMRNSPTVIFHHTGSIGWPGKDPNLVVPFADEIVGYDFAKTMKLKLVAGRDFSKDFGSDSADFLINETAAKKIGFDNAVGQTMFWGNHQGKVIGVLQDFHFNSMHQAIEPLIIHLEEKWNWGTILIRVEAGKTREAIAGLEKICKELNPKFPFAYQFSDQEFNKLYKSEEIVSKLSNYFAFLGIFISCLGLFGLATFTAARRRKEIGVRKVLGASVPSIISLLVTNFLKPVALAFIIATPIAWYAMKSWLQGFAYKIDFSWTIFLVAFIITFLIALLTIGFQSFKAALTNPVQGLRTE
ncbi:MAG: hypothetical protein C5B52_03600 [Bacteroidetes bacterium]|nr:MAG: hypothetical protein C5B52_03600 [Bacteroidota bacterium]